MDGRSQIAQTEAGRVAGVSTGDSGIVAFRGIPFAAPPVGANRWRPAQRVDSWDGVRPANRYAPAPLQSQPPTNSIMYATNFADPDPLVMSEDCLYLNVWSPDPSTAGLPVLVWVPGGGNRFGSGSQALYDGTRLARRGIVVVTLSYRLGPLGFLAHPELSDESPEHSSGNYALTDILSALDWVQANIASFGGDPAQVTVVGNSAGAAHICHLMASPLAPGLFVRAIAQSGSGFGNPHRPTVTLAEAEEAGVQFAKERGAPSVAALRTLAGAELILGGQVGAIVDNWVLPTETRVVYERGEQIRVPLIVGNNNDEAALYASPTTLADLRRTEQQHPDLADRFRAAYPAEDDAEAGTIGRRMQADAGWRWPAWKWAAVHAATSGCPVWLYSFDQTPPIPTQGLKGPRDGRPQFEAFHTAELPYMWDNLHVRPWPWTSTDEQLADAMSAAWTRFVATGEPGGGAIGEWPPITDPLAGPVMEFGAKPHAAPVRQPESLDLQDELMTRYRANPTPATH